MKKLKNTKLRFYWSFAILFALLSFISISCSSDNDDDDKVVGGNGNSYMKVTINGKEENLTDVRARWMDNSNYLEVSVRTKDNQSIMITVISDTKVPIGSYSLDSSQQFKLISIYSDNRNNAQKNYTASYETIWPDSFNLAIEIINSSKVEGKFAGILVIGNGDEVEAKATLTNGSFSAPFK